MESSSEYCCDDTPKIIKEKKSPRGAHEKKILKADMMMCYGVGEC